MADWASDTRRRDQHIARNTCGFRAYGYCIRAHAVGACFRDSAGRSQDRAVVARQRLAGRCLQAVSRQNGRQLSRLSVRTPSAVPEVPRPPNDESHLGLPATSYVEPWQHLRGCCVTEEKWTCSTCRHTW